MNKTVSIVLLQRYYELRSAFDSERSFQQTSINTPLTHSKNL